MHCDVATFMTSNCEQTLGYAKFVFKILSPVLAIMLGLMMWLKGGSLIWIFILPIVSYAVYLRLNHVMTNEKLKKE